MPGAHREGGFGLSVQPQSALGPLVGDFAAGCRMVLDPDVSDSARLRLLDTIGIALPALDLDTTVAARRLAVAESGPGPATMLGHVGRRSATWAAFANGVATGSLEYDDTHFPAIVHPSASVVPAALAAAEQSDASLDEVIAGIAAGVEIAVRMALAGYDPVERVSLFLERGLSATAICGTVGSAVAASVVLGASSDEICDALGAAASMASGVLEANRTGGTSKRTHYGWAAHAGVAAALMARAGLSGPPTALEGRYGLLPSLLGDAARLDVIGAGLGSEWHLPTVDFKRYPANGFTHAAIDAVSSLRKAGLLAEDVDAVTLAVAGPCVRTIGQPIERKRRPASMFDAQRSGPFVIAAALLGRSRRGLGVEDFDPARLVDARYLELMDRVEVVADPAFDAVYPRRRRLQRRRPPEAQAPRQRRPLPRRRKPLSSCRPSCRLFPAFRPISTTRGPHRVTRSVGPTSRWPPIWFSTMRSSTGSRTTVAPRCPVSMPCAVSLPRAGSGTPIGPSSPSISAEVS